MYVYIYIYIHTHKERETRGQQRWSVSLFANIYTHTYIYTYIHIHKHTCVYTYTCTHMYKYTQQCRHTWLEALRASSAAPYFFEEFVLGTSLRLQDGAIVANNPTIIALQVFIICVYIYIYACA